MPWLELTGLTRKPSDARLDHTKPVAAGLVGLWLMHEGGGARINDLTGRFPATIGGSGYVWRPGTYGPQGEFAGAAYATNANVGAVMGGATQAGLAARIWRTTTSNLMAVGFSATSGSPFHHFNLFWDTDSRLYIQCDNGSQSYPYVDTLPGQGPYDVVVSYDGSKSALARLTVWANGIARTLTAGGADPVAALSSSTDLGPFDIGREDSSSRFASGRVEYAALWNRALTASDALALTDNPLKALLWEPRIFLGLSSSFTATIAGTQAAQTEAIVAAETFTGTVAGTQAVQTEAVVAAETFTGTIAGAQAAQTQAIAAKETFTGAIAGAQAVQTEAVTATETFTGTVSGAQAAQTEAIAAKETFTGTVAGAQAAQTGAIVAAETFTGAVAGAQAAQTEAITATTGFIAAIAGVQAAQTGAAAAVETFVGAVSGTQAAQTGAIVATEAYTAAVAGVQAAQTEAIAAAETFTGSIAGTQAAQAQAITATAGAVPAPIMYGPLRAVLDDTGVRTVPLTESGVRALTLTVSGTQTVLLDESGVRSLVVDESGVRSLTVTEPGTRAVTLDETGARGLTIAPA